MPDTTWEDIFDLKPEGFSKRNLRELKSGLRKLFKSLDEDGHERAEIIAEILKQRSFKIPIKHTSLPGTDAGVGPILEDVTLNGFTVSIREYAEFNPTGISKLEFVAKNSDMKGCSLKRSAIHEALHILYPEEEENQIVERVNAILNPNRKKNKLKNERFGYFFTSESGLPETDIAYTRAMLKAYRDGFISKREEFKLNQLYTTANCVRTHISADKKEITGCLDLSSYNHNRDIGTGEEFTLSRNGIKVE